VLGEVVGRAVDALVLGLVGTRWQRRGSDLPREPVDARPELRQPADLRAIGDDHPREGLRVAANRPPGRGLDQLLQQLGRNGIRLQPPDGAGRAHDLGQRRIGTEGEIRRHGGEAYVRLAQSSAPAGST